MLTMKSVVGVIGGLAVVLYCGGLLYYFIDVGGSVEQAQEIGLGPTLLGLGAIGLVFCIVLIVRIVRIFFAGSRSPESGVRRSSSVSTRDGEDEFGADAVVARYMAGRSAQAAPDSPGASRAQDRSGPAGRPTFGRKVR